MKPFLVRFGAALALSFAGLVYYRLKNKRTKPCLPPTSPRSSEHGDEVDAKATSQQINEFSSSVSASSHVTVTSERFVEERRISKTGLDNSMAGLSPSSGRGGDGYLLPEFNDIVKQYDFDVLAAGIFPRKEADAPRSAVVTPVALKTAETIENDYDQGIKRLGEEVRRLQERERNLEDKLLEYYGLKEQETAVSELQNRLKINNVETKFFTLKIESLQAEKQRLEAQVADQAKIASELEAAKAKIRYLKKILKQEAEKNQEQLLNLQKRVVQLQEHDVKPDGKNQDIQLKLQKLKVLEDEAEELRKSNKRLQRENQELSRRLDSPEIQSSVYDHHETEALNEMNNRLRRENDELQKEIDRLQADRCADAEELVYLKWINACLRYELRNYKPSPGKTVARDLSRSLSPRSEKKAKQLILAYANHDVITDTDFDEWSSSQTSCLTDSGEWDDFSVDTSSLTRTDSTSKGKILTKLKQLVRGKDRRRDSQSSLPDVEFQGRSFRKGDEAASEEQGKISLQLPQMSFRHSLDVPRLNKENVRNVRRNSDTEVSSTYAYKRFILDQDGASDPALDSRQVDEDTDLMKYAEVLQRNRSRKGKHKKSFSTC